MKDVFVSHATEDAALAHRLAAFLEACGIQCFLASRDIPPGAVWDEAVVDGIDHCAGMVLILSARANESVYVKNEINRAFSKNKTLFVFRTEEVALGKSLELYLARHQWIDGFPGPVEEQFSRLAEALGQWLGRPVAPAALALASSGAAVAAPPVAVRKRTSWVFPAPTRSPHECAARARTSPMFKLCSAIKVRRRRRGTRRCRSTSWSRLFSGWSAGGTKRPFESPPNGRGMNNPRPVGKPFATAQE